MSRYRFDFFASGNNLVATHEIDYSCDQAAIKAGHEINGHPTIGCCFKIWHGDRLVLWHRNELRDQAAAN